MNIDDALTPEEITRLGELESIVETGLMAFTCVWHALSEIRDTRLYRAYGTFNGYCQDRFGFTANYAYRLIRSLEVWANLEGAEELPTKEVQMRPLVNLAPDKQRALWAESVSRYGPNPQQVQIELVVMEDLVRETAPFDVKEAMETGLITPKKAFELAQILQTVNSHVRDVVLTWGFMDGHVISSSAIRALSDVYGQSESVFQEIAASGCVQGAGDPIPLAQANERDILDVLTQDRFENRQQDWEIRKSVSRAALANTLMDGRSRIVLATSSEDIAQASRSGDDIVVWAWMNSDDEDLLHSLATNGFQVVACMAIRGNPALNYNGRPALVDSITDLPAWFANAAKSSVIA